MTLSRLRLRNLKRTQRALKSKPRCSTYFRPTKWRLCACQRERERERKGTCAIEVTKELQWTLQWINLCYFDEHRTTPRRRCASARRRRQWWNTRRSLRVEHSTRQGWIDFSKEAFLEREKNAIDCILDVGLGLWAAQNEMGLGCWRGDRNWVGSVRFFYRKNFGFLISSIEGRRGRKSSREWQTRTLCGSDFVNLESLSFFGEIFKCLKSLKWRKSENGGRIWASD